MLHLKTLMTSSTKTHTDLPKQTSDTIIKPPMKAPLDDKKIYTYDEFLIENLHDNYHWKPNRPNHWSRSIHKIDSIQITNVRSDIPNTYNVNEDLCEPTKENLQKRHQVYSSQNFSHYPLGLNVMLEHTPRNYCNYPYYQFSCSALLRRDQIRWHVLNNHVDIAFDLNGWLMQRCPLAQYGCPYYQMRLKPTRQRGVRFMKEFSCFTSYYDSQERSNKLSSVNCCSSVRGRNVPADLQLVDLPNELLMHLFQYLDNLSLNCIAKTCNRLRKIAFSLIDSFGVVFTVWRKKTYEESGSKSWREERKVKYYMYTFILFIFCKLVAPCKAEATTRQRATSGFLPLSLIHLFFVVFLAQRHQVPNLIYPSSDEDLNPRPCPRELNTLPLGHSRYVIEPLLVPSLVTAVTRTSVL